MSAGPLTLKDTRPLTATTDPLLPMVTELSLNSRCSAAWLVEIWPLSVRGPPPLTMPVELVVRSPVAVIVDGVVNVNVPDKVKVPLSVRLLIVVVGTLMTEYCTPMTTSSLEVGTAPVDQLLLSLQEPLLSKFVKVLVAGTTRTSSGSTSGREGNGARTTMTAATRMGEQAASELVQPSAKHGEAFPDRCRAKSPAQGLGAACPQ